MFLSGIGVSKVSCISHEHVPLINVDMIEKGTACNVSCIERHVDIFDELDDYDEGEARASQKPGTSPSHDSEPLICCEPPCKQNMNSSLLRKIAQICQ